MDAVRLRADEEPAIAALAAVRAGDLAALDALLAAHPDLATARILRRSGGAITLLHAVTDWPGHLPNGAATIRRLVAAGAAVDARAAGRTAQTPLHWAASSDDVAALDALLDAGADIEAPGAFDGVGGPLDCAVAFGQWAAARRLVARGARAGLWHAAALGLIDDVDAAFASAPRPTRDEVDEAFWQACHGGQQGAAAYLLARGADVNHVGHGGASPLDVARAGSANAGAPTADASVLATLVGWLEDRGARPASGLR